MKWSTKISGENDRSFAFKQFKSWASLGFFYTLNNFNFSVCNKSRFRFLRFLIFLYLSAAVVGQVKECLARIKQIAECLNFIPKSFNQTMTIPLPNRQNVWMYGALGDDPTNEYLYRWVNSRCGMLKNPYYTFVLASEHSCKFAAISLAIMTLSNALMHVKCS